MSWYFFGGFSAYAMEPSARWENHSGCSVTHGWSGEACRAKSMRDLETERLGLGHEPVEGLEVAEVGMDGVVAALGGCRSPTASQGRPDRGSGCCSHPCGTRSRWDGSAARRSRRSPWPAAASSRSCEESKVPDFQVSVSSSYSAPWERGKNSYQEANERLSAIDIEGVVRRWGRPARAVRTCPSRPVRHRPARPPADPRPAGRSPGSWPPRGAARRSAASRRSAPGRRRPRRGSCPRCRPGRRRCRPGS